MVLEQRPTFRTVSIMPGMDIRAPERHETRRGFLGSPNFISMVFSTALSALSTWPKSSGGNFILLAK
ncbi:hypothetical protein R80B4_02155 [Fibrobacteres bacterium R8-0-B4]